MDKDQEITIEQYINILHRLTNYSEDVIKEYINQFDKNNLGAVTIHDISKDEANNKFYWIEKKLKIQKLINLSK